MRIIDLIIKKKRGGVLSKEEIDFFISGYVSEDIPDYQVSSLLMAIYFQGMNKQETTDLTMAMVNSGDKIDLSSINGIKVDKHSTGGVADTATLIVGPLVAAAGGMVAKMSGRGLGHTGGTLDKLESIPGLNISQTMERFAEIVNTCGVSVVGQTGNLVPADKKLYALRDVTGTVDNVSLISGSVMSKKLASGSDKIVLDVKTGSGAFMKDVEGAVELAKMMVDIGTLSGKETVALVTDMNQPLGNAVGNALEVIEAIEILGGKHEGDLKTVSCALASKMLILGGIFSSEAEAMAKINEVINNGEALNRFGQMIEMQGGNSEVINNTGLLAAADSIIEVKAEKDGYIQSMNTENMGMVALLLGAGRTKKTDVVDPAVGYWLKKRIGDSVSKGDVLADFYVNDKKNLEESISLFKNSVIIGNNQGKKIDLIYDTIS
ncbi:MAG: pyrimidine-nucleoside phosphorylase [Spirochaetia bacterium]|jgi:pyrimidine-nucleoside phosphorylase|nr:pyrimidine-nucleoside phosphorylase [Spirochaetia bacterium]